jgi:hypothetical protein
VGRHLAADAIADARRLEIPMVPDLLHMAAHPADEAGCTPAGRYEFLEAAVSTVRAWRVWSPRRKEVGAATAWLAKSHGMALAVFADLLAGGGGRNLGVRVMPTMVRRIAGSLLAEGSQDPVIVVLAHMRGNESHDGWRRVNDAYVLGKRLITAAGDVRDTALQLVRDGMPTIDALTAAQLLCPEARGHPSVKDRHF